MKKAQPIIAGLASVFLSAIPFPVHAADPPARAAITLAGHGVTAYAICVSPDAPAIERRAADDLSSHLSKITGCAFTVSTRADPARPRIAVGPVAAREVDPLIDLDRLGDEGLVMRSHGEDLILTGGVGAQRGTLYAVEAFLQEFAGVRWWAPEATFVPTVATLTVPALDRRSLPAFEYRDIFWTKAFDPDWSMHNRVNGTYRHLEEGRGGGVSYADDDTFVHSFYNLINPARYFATHPEWYAQIGGVRTWEKSQLCLSNRELLVAMIAEVRTRLKAHPQASIISISQNDMPDAARSGRCTCDACLAIEADEGSPMGPLLRFVNAIAEDIAADFPKVAVDTLAYQYTRKPPRHAVPRPNVIIRLCSIECTFARPLESDANAAFRDDLVGWSKICQRLYIWDYTTSFTHYALPYPDLRVLGPNVASYARNHVRGVLEQGNHTGPGAEFAELRGWVLAQLLWDPTRDAQALIDEFLRGYYGAAAPRLREYIDLVHDRCESSGCELTIDAGPDLPFYTANLLSRCDRLLTAARATVADDPVLLGRVELASVPIRYVAAARWKHLCADPAWPFGSDRAELVAGIVRICGEHQVTRFGEDKGVDLPGTFALRYGAPRATVSPRPAAFDQVSAADLIDLQDCEFSLWGRPEKVEWRADPLASDGMAAWMPGNHLGWNVYMGLDDRAYAQLDGVWTAYVVVRVKGAGNGNGEGTGDGDAIGCGVHGQGAGGQRVAERIVPVTSVADGAYHTIRIGAFTPKSSYYLWVSPRNNPAITEVFVDRFILVRGDRSEQK
ncbi:MAG: DUF4838 domain-containing protein [Planctomycetes bacterium]|nr:DUF4838 domain-containing protein [Planctomycetota bacterium]